MQLLRNNPSRARGFTLIELLVVIAIVAVLAALLLTALGGARGRGKAIQCLNNVRQLSLGVSSFVSQHGAYPLYVNPPATKPLHPEHGNTWFSSVSPEAGVPLGGAPGQTGRILHTGIWDCPAAPASKPADYKPSEGYVDYGYNANGVGDHTLNNGLGLGGHILGPEERRSVKESEVVAPSSTYALGDGFVGETTKIEDGRPILGRRTMGLHHEGSTKRSERRHSGKANIAFADGHVEAVSLKLLFVDQSDVALSRWNYDHQPHRERLNQ